MAEQSITGSIAAPGFYGLNTQDSSVQLNSGFALEANNCVIDKYGRIGARHGWTPVNTSPLSPDGSVRTIFEFVKADGNLTFMAANNKIYGTHPITQEYVEYPVGGTHFYTGTYSQTETTVTVTSVENHALTTGDTVWFDSLGGTTPDGFYTITVDAAKIFHFTAAASATTSGTCQGINIISYAISGDNWQVASMPYGTGITASAHCVWVQEGQAPLIMHRLGTTAHSHIDGYGFQRLGDVSTLPTGYTVDTFKPSCAITAYGRMWAANVSSTDTQTVYFSDLQDPSVWTTGTAGYLDISTVIPSGDPIVAIASHNGFLIIFCRRHIVVYSGASDPATMTLSDVVSGVGCIARDTVQSVAGTDLLFLSETGVQSFQRVIQEKSLPFRDVSKNVRDDLLGRLASETEANIKGIYYPTDAFYLLALPANKVTYCFDTRGALQNGSARTTLWNGINPTAFCVTADKKLYLGQEGYIGNYTGYEDNTSTYRFAYYTNYFDFDQPSILKILKKINMIAIGGSGQPIVFKWAFDYNSNYNSGTLSLDEITIAEYGIAEYGVAQYTNGIALDNVTTQASGTGRILQLGFEADINGAPLSIQKIDFSLKSGKTVI